MHAWGPACQVGRIEVARLLLAAGASPNATDEAGDTPLHRVLGSRLVGDPSEFVALLLDHGADPTQANLAGLDALTAARTYTGRAVETYFPRRSLGTKQLDRALELLEAAARARKAQNHWQGRSTRS